MSNNCFCRSTANKFNFFRNEQTRCTQNIGLVCLNQNIIISINMKYLLIFLQNDFFFNKIFISEGNVMEF